MTKKKMVRSITLFIGLSIVLWPMLVQAGIFMPVTMIDFSPVHPLDNPVPSSYQPRYISGFGSDDAFTVFFEDRDAGNAISFVSTTTGPTGFPTNPTATNIIDTHFLVKDWPVNIAGTDYAYRGWGAVGNNPDHRFYVSDNLIDWTLVSTFTVTNTVAFTHAKGYVYYGFHDVIQINGTYYAFGESNQSQTMLVRSDNGMDDWEAFDSIGGVTGDGPLELPSGITSGWTPSGSFFELGHDRGYGKIHVDPRDEYFYLAVNTEAKPSLSPVDLEAAFIDPNNWTWHDGSTGPAAAPILPANLIHDLREAWLVPSSDPDSGWTLIYDGDYGTERGGKALGYAYLNPPALPDEYDFGDAPDSTYPTLLANNGARHKIVSGFFMGPAIDSESDGQPDGTATGDDLNGIDDEDGVIFSDVLRQCENGNVEVTVPKAGKLDAWMDFNGDGDWNDPGEQIFSDQVLNIYTNSLDFEIPCEASLSPIFARFRLSSEGGLSYDGLAEDGEVEDYQLTISSKLIEVFLPLMHR